MPLIERTNVGEHSELVIWKITETRSELQALLPASFADKGGERLTQLHWLASRVLLAHCFPNQHLILHKDERNKPMLEVDGNPYFISISHAHQYACVLLSKTQKVGVDIEKIDERVNRVRTKFLRPDEYFFGETESAIYPTIIWSAKESLYKQYGLKELDFKAHLQVLPFAFLNELFYITGLVTKTTIHRQQLAVRCFDNCVLTYTV
jgi:4'-phosphopantetheinyl transferase